MQTIYRLTAINPVTAAEIVSYHDDFTAVCRMQENMQKAGWKATVEFVSADWRPVVDGS